MRLHGLLFLAVLALAVVLTTPAPAGSSADDRTITSMETRPDNTFDNVGGENVGIVLNLSGGAAAGENPDDQGGYRLEVYNSDGTLVRRRTSEEVNANPTSEFQWNGRDDSNVLVPYGSYTMRALVSMRNITFPIRVQGSGISISRPGDLHVTSGGNLFWTNTKGRLSFVQVSLGDPNASPPNFVRLVDLPAGFGSSNTNQGYGITVNSANEVFVTGNNAGAVIGKYATATETWISTAWATNATTSITDDEWTGLGIDANDSVYVAMGTNVTDVGGGNGGGFEGVVQFTDLGASASQANASADLADDMYDVAVGNNQLYLSDNTDDAVDTTTLAGGSRTNNVKDIGSDPRGIWALSDGSFYVTRSSSDSFAKYNVNGVLQYQLVDIRNDGIGGIAVWRKASTNETFVITAGQTSNKINIYSENAAGNTVTFVRTIEDDVNNLSEPVGLAVDADSAIFVVSRGSDSVKKFSKDGVFQALEGTANGLYIEGTDATGGLTDTQGFAIHGAIAVDTAGFIYVFDQTSITGGGQAAIKRFSPSGVPDSVVWYDLDANVPGGAWNGEITMATFAEGAVYGVSRENDGRLFRITLNKTATWLGGGSTPTLNRDVLSFQIAPYFDRANTRFYPAAVYILTDNDRVRVFSLDLSTLLRAEFDPANPNLPTASNVTQPYLVDFFGEHYFLIDDGGASYDFQRYVAETPEADLTSTATFGFSVTQGSGDAQVNGPRQMVWVDARGAYKLNPVTGRYEQRIWLNDSNNGRLQQMLVEWNDDVETPIIVTPNSDTPIVVSASVTGNTVTTIGGISYVGRDTIQIQLNFNNLMDASTNTHAVSLKPNGGSFTSLTQISYGGSSWSGTVPITASMADGQAEIKAQDFYDNAGTIRLLSPNPDQTDFDLSDDFKHIVIDQTPPVGSVANPPSGGDTTSNATYAASGSITSEATGLDATLVLSIFTAESGGTEFDSLTVTASATDGSFTGVMDLRGPAPTDNWFQAVAVDKLGNRAPLFSGRRKIRREKNVGNAFITPATNHRVDSLDRYEIKYTAAQDLTGDTLRFTIPGAWSVPQKGTPTTNGYFTITTAGTFSDSLVAGQALTLPGTVLSNGATLSIFYGDSAISLNGRAGPNIDASLADADNTFRVELQQAGETTFTGVSAPAGKSLVVPLFDSSPAIVVTDTGPGTASVAEISKGDETSVLVLEVRNDNLGAHAHRVTQVVLSVEANTGGVVASRDAISRLVVKNVDEGITFGQITAFTASPSVTVPLSNFTVGQSASRKMEFFVTISPSATADTVRFYLSTSGMAVVDSASGKTLSTVEVETGVNGKRTGSYDLIGLAPADTLGIGFTDPLAGEVSTGQKGVTAMRLILQNDPLSTDVPVNQARIDEIQIQVRRADGTTALAGNALLSAVRIIDADNGTQYGGATPGSSETITVALANFLISSGESRTVRVEVDIQANTSTTSRFRLQLGETKLVVAKDRVTQQAVEVYDFASLPGTLPFRIDTITVVPVASATLTKVRLLRADSTLIQGELGDQILVGDVFYAELSIYAELGRSSVRMIPNDTDLVVLIGGVDKTSEFTIQKPAAATVTPGVTTTFIYSLIQNLGTTTGEMSLDNGVTGSDTRPRAFDDHDYFLPDQLRAIWSDTQSAETASIASAPQAAVALTLDTSFASPTETAVEILRLRIINNRPASRTLDKITVEGLSAGSPVLLARLYHDNKNSILNPATDTLVATGTLNGNDTTLFDLSPKVALGANGGSETFFITFDFDTMLTDGDTFDARIPANGIQILTENAFPATSLNSSGEGRVEVVASRVTATPETQIVAVGAQTTVTLRAVDRHGNIDAVANAESTVQGRNVQFDAVFRATDSFTDTTHRIVSTSGLTNVALSNESTTLNARLSSGQGILTLTDTEASPVDTLTVTSTFPETAARIQFATSITASVLTLAGADSAAPDSKAFLVLAFRVSNASGTTDTVTRVRLSNLSTTNTEVLAVVLFRDLNGNGRIDSGTDRTIATGVFSGGFVEWTGLSDTIANGDSGLYLVGVNVDTRLTDLHVVDARADSVTVSNNQELAGAGLNSTPDRKIDIRATFLAMAPNAATTDAGLSLTVTATAEDGFGNIDKNYSGGTGIEWDLSGSAIFQSSTLSNQDIDPPPDPPFDNSVVRGNLVNGTADLTFVDNTAETISLTVTLSPDLSGPHETGQFVFRAIVNPPGTAFVSPATTHQVTALDSYTITYTAGANLSGDTLRFTIPAQWSAPQKTSTTTNGYLRVFGTHTDSAVTGQQITLRGVTLSNGSSLFVAYGDTTADPNGAAEILANDPLDVPANTFKVEVYFATDTGFRNVPAAGGKTLAVPVRDSDATMSVVDTGAEGGVEIAKGSETTVLIAEFKNDNLGNHFHKINQIRLNVESNTGGAVAASDAVSRIVVKNTSEGITFATLTSIPSAANVPISLSNFTISQGTARRMEILVTISASAAADTVRFFLSAPPGGVTAVDSASGQSITVFEADTGVTNDKTGNYDIIGLAPADTMGLGFTDPAAGEVATGQQGVSAMKLIFHNIALGADTPVNAAQIDQVLLRVSRADGTTGLIPNSVLSAARLIVEGSELQVGNTTASGSGETLTFAVAGFTLASGESKTVRVEVDIAVNTTTVSSFRLRLADTTLVTATDQVTGLSMKKIDPAELAGTLPFLISTITIVPVGEATLERTTLLRVDSSVLNGPAGDLLVIGNTFYAGLRIRATAGRSSVRMVPTNSDLILRIGGVDKTSEFTVTPPAERTITAGAADTIFYQMVQNLGTTAGVLSVSNDTAGGDSQPRAYDVHDLVPPELRARWIDGSPETVQVTAASIEVNAFSLDTSFASPGETAVAIVGFRVKNNAGSIRYVDSVAIDGLSAGAAVVLARLYHDNDNSILSPATDTLVASGALNANDTILFTLSPQVGVGGGGGSETFFVAFDFATAQTDGDTFDARIPALGVRLVSEAAVPSAVPLNSTGEGRVEVVANQITAAPETQVVAVSAQPTVTLRAVDAYGNIDAVANNETTAQGHNAQLNITFRANDSFTDTTHRIVTTTGMSNVSFSNETTNVNARLVGGQGILTLTDTEASPVDTLTVTSVIGNTTARVQFATSITAAGVNLAGTDSAAADSRAFLVMKFRVTNSSGQLDTMTRAGIRSLSTNETGDVTAVVLFRDANGNGTIDSGVDRVIATGTFASGFVDFTGLADTIVTGDSALYMVGFDIAASAADLDLIDAQVDTVTVSLGGELVGTPLQSTPNRRIDIRAVRITHSPLTATVATGANVNVTVKAVDAFGNKDLNYTGNIGGGQKVEWNLTGGGQFLAASTLSNEEISPVNVIKGNFPAGTGEATLVFTDATAQTINLSVAAFPGLVGPNDTGTFTFEQGFTVADSGLVSAVVAPGDTNRVLLAFRISASGVSDSVTNIRITWSGTDTRDVTNVRLYRDLNTNDLFDAATDTFYGTPNPGTFANETVTFTGETLFVANGTNRLFFLVADVAAGATGGDTLDARLLLSSITTEGLISDVPTGTRNSAGHETVVSGSFAVSAVALGGGTVPPGASNVEIGRFSLTVPVGLGTKVLTQVRVRNAGTHPDTGLYSIRLYSDANANNTFEAATDTLFAASAAFAGNFVTFTGQDTFVEGATRRLFIVANLSDTLAVDTKTLLARLDANACTFASAEFRPTATQTPTNPARVSVALGVGLSDSVQVRAGEALADNAETILVSVSVIDSAGVPATGRTVTLTLLDAGPTILVNPVVTDDKGVALFGVRSASAGVFRCSATINGAGKASIGYLSFRDPFGVSTSADSNVSRASVSSAGDAWTGLGTYSRVTGDFYYMEYDAVNNFYRIRKHTGGAPTNVITRGVGVGDVATPDFLGTIRVANIPGGGGEEILFTGIDDEANYRSEIYAIQPDGSGLTRVSPNDPRDTDGLGDLDWNRSWRTFDIQSTGGGDTFWVGFEGNLTSFTRAGAQFNPGADSKTIRLWTFLDSTFVFSGAGAPAGYWIQDPEVSPDGSRVAFTLLHLPAGFQGINTTTADAAEIWVLKDLGTIVPGNPVTNDSPFQASSVTTLADSHLVQITRTSEVRFAWRPHWSPDGSILMYSADTTGGFNMDLWVSNYPYAVDALGPSDFNVWMTYYDAGAETTPYKPARFLFEGSSIDEIAGEFDRFSGTKIPYDRSPATSLWQTRSVTLSNQATVTTNGGVLFDSGRVVVYVPSGETLATGTEISSRTPTSTPPYDSGIVITGAAKEFFSPGNPNAHVTFSESITVVLQYDAADFSGDALLGFDSDGDGIPDRTEAALDVYHWNGSAWIPFTTTRDPVGNRLIFQTTHFSIYAGGHVSGLTFTGSVQDAVVFPNPWRIDGIGTATAGLSPGDPRYGIKIDRLPNAAVGFRIFTIAGQKVIEGTLNTGATGATAAGGHLRSLGDGRVSWDLRNQSGREVASGVYIVVLTGPGGTATRKVAVIR